MEHAEQVRWIARTLARLRRMTEQGQIDRAQLLRWYGRVLREFTQGEA